MLSNLIYQEELKMKKLVTILSVCAMIFAVSCASGLDADASRSGGSEGPSDLIRDPSSITVITKFINDNAGVYYSEGQYAHWEWGIGYTNYGLKVDYKFKDGKVYVPNKHNQLIDLMAHPVEAVSPTDRKLQLRDAEKGEVLVLNITDEGLESYVSYILEKVSDDVLIENGGVGAFEESLIPYKGTYNSIAQDNKIENYIAIDGEGYVYFHDANVTYAGERVGITEDGELTILESHKNIMRKIIFKFDQGVYRRFAIDGAREYVDESYIGICQVSPDFIEDKVYNATYVTSDYKWEDVRDTQWGRYPERVSGVGITLNQNPANGTGHIVSEGAVAISGTGIGDAKGHVARGAQVGHVSVLKGNQLHVMGRYNAIFTFSEDWKTLTYNGQTLTMLDGGEIKATAPAERRVKRITKRF